MKRHIYKQLLNWKLSADRKPLILQGARQTGKTYLLREFGKEFDELAYFNFEEDPRLISLFEASLDPHSLIEKLSLYRNKKITPSNTLIFFDEIQEAPRALTALKYFQEKAPECPVVAAGSLLGIKYKNTSSFPVGKVHFLSLYPMTFLEFLEALEKENLKNILLEKKDFEPLPQVFHADLLDLLKRYYLIGGMPEVVSTDARNQDFEKARAIQKEILKSYSHDFSKHAAPIDAPRIQQVWNSIPSQLSRENKKFIFTEIKKTARGRDYQNALQWLCDAGLILMTYNISRPQLPLSGYAEKNIFKIYLLDTGLLGAMLDLTPRMIVDGDQLFSQYRGAFVENYVAQELKACSQDLYYWSSSGIAEVDFIIAKDGNITPLEVKSSLNQRTKSLASYSQKYHPPSLEVTSPANYYLKGNIHHYPLYSIGNFQNR